jgi:hypothetical protein
MDSDLHGQPLQLTKVIYGIAYCRGAGAWCCSHKRTRSTSIDNPEGGEEQGSCRETLWDNNGRQLHNLDACPDLFAVSVYDTKPVHILSTAADCVEWIVKEKKVWSDGLQKKALMKYLWLTVISNYNNNMNLTDIAYQLRGSYRPDRWMRQCKWCLRSSFGRLVLPV